jgi:hypothetical protein
MQQIKDLLPAAVASNLEQVQPKNRLPETTEELQFEMAVAEKKIWHLEGEEELKQALRYIFILVGLRAHNYPMGIEKQLLHAYIFKNYGGHTPEELKLAFEMALQNKLSLRTEDVVCYENFSIAYFSRIMEAYREWAREQIKRLSGTVEQPKQFSRQEKLQLDFDYAYLLLSQVNKLPCKV